MFKQNLLRIRLLGAFVHVYRWLLHKICHISVQNLYGLMFHCILELVQHIIDLFTHKIVYWLRSGHHMIETWLNWSISAQTTRRLSKDSMLMTWYTEFRTRYTSFAHCTSSNCDKTHWFLVWWHRLGCDWLVNCIRCSCWLFAKRKLPNTWTKMVALI